MDRARTTGQLDAPGSAPLSDKMDSDEVPSDYTPNVIDFFLPLVVLIAVAIGTFITTGSPKVKLAFGLAFAMGVVLSLGKGMKLSDLMSGINNGFKSVVMGSVILLLAIIIGNISKQTGGGLYLVELLGDKLPYFLLPIILQGLTMLIAFSTGTSWGTYAVTFPLAMPLAWAVALNSGVDNMQLFMLICFAAVLNGSVYGDQCSPISDTTILSSVFTGCDLMDHVKTQFTPATYAAAAAGVGWTLTAMIFV